MCHFQVPLALTHCNMSVFHFAALIDLKQCTVLLVPHFLFFILNFMVWLRSDVENTVIPGYGISSCKFHTFSSAVVGPKHDQQNQGKEKSSELFGMYRRILYNVGTCIAFPVNKK